MLYDFRGFKFSRRPKELLCVRKVTDFIGFLAMTKGSYTYKVFYYCITFLMR
jgi:hypothetical protein